ncbi:MAG: hypothetical protein LBN97_03225, partial [Oscillospiraceae bacterium]|nr:hypothetical protein [Oscillospiraceae bacterium]
ISDIISFAALPSDAEIYAFVDSIQITDEQRRIYAEQHGLQGNGAAAASPSPASGLRQGEYIWETSDKMRYKFTLLDGVPQPMGTSVQETYNGTVTETIMAYASSRSSADDEWGEWRVAPHYWAGLQCSDCEELNADGVIPESYMLGFSHAWSGEWKNSPPVYKY